MSETTSLPAAAVVVADTIVCTVELGVTITDAAVDGDATVVFCNRLDDGRRHCPGCGAEGVYRDTVIHRVTDVPVVGHPLLLRVRVPRYRCRTVECDREVFVHNTDRLAPPRMDHDPAVRPLHRAPADDRPRHRRGSGPRTRVVLGHREHHRDGRHPDDPRRRHHPAATGCGSSASTSTAGHTPADRGEDGFVTVIIDLTPVLDGTGRARLLDLVPGRSAAALNSWLAAQTAASATRSRSWRWTGSAATRPRPPRVLPEATR